MPAIHQGESVGQLAFHLLLLLLLLLHLLHLVAIAEQFVVGRQLIAGNIGPEIRKHLIYLKLLNSVLYTK